MGTHTDEWGLTMLHASPASAWHAVQRFLSSSVESLGHSTRSAHASALADRQTDWHMLCICFAAVSFGFVPIRVCFFAGPTHSFFLITLLVLISGPVEGCPWYIVHLQPPCHPRLIFDGTMATPSLLIAA